MDEFIDLIPEPEEKTLWLYYLRLDDDGYIETVSYQPEITEIPEEAADGQRLALESIDDYDFTGERLHAYRWDEDAEALLFDAVRYAELTKELAKEHTALQILELTQRLRQSDNIILEALEGLLGATTLAGFLSALISAAKSVKDTLTERTDIRAQIENLKEGTSEK